MQSFKDNNGQSWDFRLSVGLINKIKSRCKVDLLDLGAQDFLRPLFDDDRMLIELFWVLSEKQALELSVNAEEYAELFDSETIELATKSFTDELINFFRGKKKEALKKLLAKTNNVIEAGFDKIGLEIDAINEEELAEKAIKPMREKLDQI